MSARPDRAQLTVSVPKAFKTKLAADAKKAKRTLAEEIVFHCTLKERMRADLAAGRVPVVDAEPVPAPAASPALAQAASQLADDAASVPPSEILDLLHDLREACLEQDTDTCIPGSLGKRLQAILAIYPRAAA